MPLLLLSAAAAVVLLLKSLACLWPRKTSPTSSVSAADTTSLSRKGARRKPLGMTKG